MQGATYWPDIHVTNENLGDAIEAAGMTWKAYEQGMGPPGNLSNVYDAYYYPDDAPFVNFTDIQTKSTARFASTPVLMRPNFPTIWRLQARRQILHGLLRMIITTASLQETETL